MKELPNHTQSMHFLSAAPPARNLLPEFELPGEHGWVSCRRPRVRGKPPPGKTSCERHGQPAGRTVLDENRHRRNAGKELGFEVAAGNRGLRSLTRKPCLLPPGRTAAQRPPQCRHRHKSVGEGGYPLIPFRLLNRHKLIPSPFGFLKKGNKWRVPDRRQIFIK